jgi:hypothetical protein
MTINELRSYCLLKIEDLLWTDWKALHEPTAVKGKGFAGHDGPGVYQLRDKNTLELLLIGIGKNCIGRMRSVYPGKYGTGTRNNKDKQNYAYQNWRDIEYRILKTDSILDAKLIESALLAGKNHRFNT